MTDDLDYIEISTVVQGLYRSLLSREADQLGLHSYIKMLSQKEISIEELCNLLLGSDEFRQRRLSEEQFASHRPTRFTNDMSQFGEFEILLKHWINSYARHRILVDVGARGRERSNSYDLLRVFGWRGILVEANPMLIPKIKEEFDGLDCEIINCAVSDYEGAAPFHIGVNDDVSSLNEEASLSWGSISKTIQVSVRKLSPQLYERNIPYNFDLLSLDIEGEDIKVLNDLMKDGVYIPRWIIIEASNNHLVKSLNDLPFSDIVKARYDISGQTSANLILKSKYD